jgi:hypothetical protein
MATKAKIMGKGWFKLVRGWTTDDGFTVEYWLGVSGNGACLRTVNPDGLVMTSHVHDPRRIENWLAGYEYEMERGA